MSTLKADTIQSTGGGAATLTKQSAAKAVLNYDHVINSINSSTNISSVTDNSTGLPSPVFTNSMSNALYSIPSGTAQENGGANASMMVCSLARNTSTSLSTSSFNLQVSSSGSAAYGDAFNVCCSVFGDLA